MNSGGVWRIPVDPQRFNATILNLMNNPSLPRTSPNISKFRMHETNRPQSQVDWEALVYCHWKRISAKCHTGKATGMISTQALLPSEVKEGRRE
jgi:hypothetical protein